MSNNNIAKLAAAQYAIQYIKEDITIGIGTGSTVNCLIELLGQQHLCLGDVVSSSKQTTELLSKYNIKTTELNNASSIDIYIDGADEVNSYLHMIKGGGAALTGEKLLVANSKQVICIVDESKYVAKLGDFGIPVEVIPMARSYVARELVKLGGTPNWRVDINSRPVVTDYGNWILDVHNLEITHIVELELQINQIEGVVSNGLFAKRPANMLIIGKNNGSVEVIE